MHCTECGQVLAADSEFCQACGKPVNSVQEPAGKWQEFKGILSSSKETIIAVLGAAIGKQLLATGEAKGGCAVLSDKRLYIKGTCFRKKNNLFFPHKEETILDVKDITSTGHFKQDVSWMKTIGIICLVVALICCQAFSAATKGEQEMDAETAMKVLVIGAYGCLIAGITLLVLYKRCHAEIFQIICPGNVIGLNTNYIRREEWEYFQSCIRQQKDAVAVAEEPAIDDVDATLAKYMAWLEEGKITQEEYDALKKKLLNL